MTNEEKILELLTTLQKDMTEVIYIIVGGFIKLFLRLSTQRVNNQIFCCRGHIIELYYKSKTKNPVRFNYRTIYNNNKIVIHKGQSRKSAVLSC